MRPISEVPEKRLVRRQGRTWLLAAKGATHAVLSSGQAWHGGAGIQELVRTSELVEVLEDGV